MEIQSPASQMFPLRKRAHNHARVQSFARIKSNQIKSLLLSHHHSTSALVSEILMSVLQTVQKNNRQFTYGQTVQKTALEHLQCSRQCKKTTAIYIWTDSAKKTTAIYIWTVHIYRLYRRQCAKYTYIYSVRLVYYKDILNYRRHIIHRMGTSTLCTVSIHNVVYTLWGATDYKLTADWLVEQQIDVQRCNRLCICSVVDVYCMVSSDSRCVSAVCACSPVELC